MQYDNVPRPAVFPQTAYDNVPTNTTGYDNAPPPNVHAWTHECCGTDDKATAQLPKECVASEPIRTDKVPELVAKTEVKTSPRRVSDLCAQLREERQNASNASNTGTLMSVKFAEAPPETLYLPVEAKLYTRMDRPFSPTAVGSEIAASMKQETKQEPTVKTVSYGPYDNVPVPEKGRHFTSVDFQAYTLRLVLGKAELQKKSPDLAATEIDPEFKSMKLIEQTIQVIEQSSKDMEENVDAMVRCPSRSSQRSANASNGSRPVTPSNSPKKLSKVPPPVSPKPKLLLVAKAPLAQPETDDLGTSTDSMEFKPSIFPAMKATPSIASSDSERKTLPKRIHHRSTSRRRSTSGHEHLEKTTVAIAMGGSIINVKPTFVDHEAQVDSGTASSECGGSVCSCSGGSQCSLANSGAPSTNEDGDEKREPGPEGVGDVVSPIDEQAEWKKVRSRGLVRI